MFSLGCEDSVDDVWRRWALTAPTEARSFFAAAAATRESANAVNWAHAAPPVAWWLCTFDGPAQRLGMVSAALRGTSGHAAMKHRPSQGALGA